ncbi:MAG: tyrosine-type recombinase/integrase, partial [Planctomycetales bacterium]|nr:tyrosine-type recombinase/integrase [Planctomycetales bacterium]
MSDTPPAEMTLAEFFESVYPKRMRHPDGIRYKLRMLERVQPTQPPIKDIDDAWLSDLRERMEAADLSPRSVKTALVQCLTLLRHAGPRNRGFPGALGILPEVPYVEMPRIVRKRPRRLSLDDLSRVYVECKTMKWPSRKGVAPPIIWRAALALAYATAMRRGDLFQLRWESIDFEQRQIEFCATKTGKDGVWPLPQYAIDHLLQLRDGDTTGYVFRRWALTTSSRLYGYLHELSDRAGIERFGFHDIRRTAASEIERVQPGMAAILLQHSPRSVTERYYLDCSPELREAVEKMRVPVGFSAGPGMYERVEIDKQKQAARVSPIDYDVTGLDRSDWEFSDIAFAFRGRWFPLSTKWHLLILRTIVENGGPVERDSLVATLNAAGYEFGPIDVTRRVGKLRRRLRVLLGISDDFDPMPPVRDHSQHAQAWTVCVPKWLRSAPIEKTAAIRRDLPDAQQRKLVNWIRSRGGAVTVNDVRKNNWTYRHGDEAELALRSLIRAGFGEWQTVPPSRKGGRPRLRFVLRDGDTST